MLRNLKGVLGGLLLLLCLGCGGDEPGGEPFAIYHLETAIGRSAATDPCHGGLSRVRAVATRLDEGSGT
jgi:hypothetical protein